MRLGIVLILLLTVAANLQGHDLFLKANPFLLENPGTATLAMYLAEAFPGSEQKWRSGKTVKFWMVGPQGEKQLDELKEKNQMIPLNQPGTYVIGWNGSATYIEIEPKIFNEYIDAEGYSDVVNSREKEGKTNSPGREKYIRFLKSIVQVGSEKTDSYSKPLGQKIELVPLSNPYSLAAGSELRVRVLFDGQPLANIRVMATYDSFSKEHDVYAHTAQSGSDGVALIPIDHSGIWMIRANHMLPLQGDPKADWQSYWANISFFVK